MATQKEDENITTATTQEQQEEQKQTEKEKKSYGGQMVDAGKKLAQSQRDLAKEQADKLTAQEETRKTKQAAINKDIKDTINKGLGDTQAEYDKLYGENGVLSQIYKDRQAELKRKEEEYATKTKQDYRAAQWAGITEVAAGIANAIGVAHGASNQRINSVSKDWMAKAEANEKDRKTHLDALADQLDAKKKQIAQGKLQSMLAAINAQRDAGLKLAALDEKELGAQAAAAEKIAGILYNGEAAASATEADAALKGIQMDQRDEAQKRDDARQQQHYNAQMRAKGLNPDGTINPQYMADLQAASSSGGASIPKDAFRFTTSQGKRYAIDKDSLVATISANIDLISGDDQKAIQKMLMGDTNITAEKLSYKLLPMMKKYPKLEKAIASSSYYVDVTGMSDEQKDKMQAEENARLVKGLGRSRKGDVSTLEDAEKYFEFE